MLTRAALCAALLTMPTGRANAQPVVLAWFGIGLDSCATWTTQTDQQIKACIVGYWSALNTVNGSNHRVGQHTDGAGLIGEVCLACNAQPSMAIGHAIDQAYSKLQALGR